MRGQGCTDYSYHLAIYPGESRMELNPGKISIGLSREEMGNLPRNKGDIEYFSAAAELALGRIATEIVAGGLQTDRLFRLSLAQARFKHLKDGIANGASPVAGELPLRH